ncbi:MAG: hypothetical protein RI904_2652 [Pseudomonadota bacterium]|jgi:Tfp pilus assembly protein PilF
MSSKYGLSWKRYKWLTAAWIALGQQERALATLEQMLTQFPCDAYALAQTAQLKAKRGDALGAISDYELLLQQPGAHDDVWITLGTLYFQNDVLDRAEVCFRTATTLGIEQEHAWYGLGVCLMRQGRLDEAVHALERTTRVEPTNPEAWVQLARIHVDRQAPDETKKIIKHLKEFEPKYAAQLERETGLAG